MVSERFMTFLFFDLIFFLYTFHYAKRINDWHDVTLHCILKYFFLFGFICLFFTIDSTCNN